MFSAGGSYQVGISGYIPPSPNRSLPAALPPRRKYGSMGAPAPSRLLSQSPTVLVVEDTVVVRRMVLRALEGAGYTVCEAGDGAEALALLTQGARVDVIVADIRMPRMDGRQLAVEMRKQSS